MIIHPSILALQLTSLLVTFMVCYAALFGVQILRSWDISSGSELQLTLERKTYLISTVLDYFLALQLISLFLFIYTADSICHLFVGAMCAVGTLTVNPFGYPALLLKLANFILVGIWLVVNHADNLGHDYPLIRRKYALLLAMTPLIIAETTVQGIYFSRLKPDIITSCCGSLFSPSSRSIATELAALPPIPVMVGFYLLVTVTCLTGLGLVFFGRGAALLAILSGVTFAGGLVAVISVFSLYIYQMPTHHCPFCILQQEYFHVGYPLYLSLLGGALGGLGSGILALFRTVPSLSGRIPPLQRRLAVLSVAGFLLFTAIATLPVVITSFRLTP